MAPPPAKRQRRSVVLSSDDGADSPPNSEDVKGKKSRAILHKSQPLPPVLPTRLRHKNGKTAATDGSQKPMPTSPPDRAAKNRKVEQKKGGSGSIYSFFNAATQTQTSSADRHPSPKVDVDEEEFMQDDISDGEIQRFAEACEAMPSAISSQAFHRKVSVNPGPNGGTEGQLNGSQRFRSKGQLLRQHMESSGKVSATIADLRPWTERYGPENLEELAVHKKKVADVRGSLESIFEGHDRKRLVVLKGPSGTGKTATLRALSKAMDFEILEWRNPVGREYSLDGYQSLPAQLEDFLGRGGKYGSLEIGPITSRPEKSPSQKIPLSPSNSKKKVVLIEEYPNTYNNMSSAFQSFRWSMVQYLAANSPSPEDVFSKEHTAPSNITPIVVIVSESLLTSSTAAADSFTAHRLLGPDLLNHPGVSVIEFNPIATTLLTKALELVIRKEARSSGRRHVPSTGILKRLSEVGDVRSAIGSLEFLCVRGDEGTDWGGRVATKGARKGGKSGSAAATKTEQESMEIITQREASLGIFHAVAKVVYNKRETPSISAPAMEPPPQPPAHLSHHSRPKVSEVRPETLIDETGTDTQTFIAALHENYILSCDAAHDATGHVNGCIEALSDSDLLCRDSHRAGSGIYQAGIDTIRQDEISFHVAVRGILFSLPYPVKRGSITSRPSQAQPSKAGPHGRAINHKADTFKMFYPTSLRLWKDQEETLSLVDRWIARSGSSSSSGTHTTLTPTTTSNTNLENDPSQPYSYTYTSASASPARTQLLLERLPYTAKIAAARDVLKSKTRIPPKQKQKHPSDLETITQFRGLGAAVYSNSSTSSSTTSFANNGDHDDGDDEKDKATGRDGIVAFGMEKKAVHRHRHGPNGEQDVKTETEKEMQKLVLSDDDIEDFD